MREVLADEGLDEPVGMVVAGVAAERQALARLLGGGLEQLGLELLGQELVVQALVDQELQRQGPAGAQERAGVVLGPGGAVGAEIARERLLAPRAPARGADRREGRDRAPLARMAQGQGQGAVAAHGVAEQALPVGVGREVGGDQGRQLRGDVALHAPVRGPGCLRGVEVEAGADAEVPGVGLAGDGVAARAGVRGHQHEAELGRMTQGAGLDQEGLLGAGEAGQIGQHRERPLAGRAEHAQAHGAAGRAAGVLVEADRAAPGLLLGQRGQRHQ